MDKLSLRTKMCLKHTATYTNLEYELTLQCTFAQLNEGALDVQAARSAHFQPLHLRYPAEMVDFRVADIIFPADPVRHH